MSGLSTIPTLQLSPAAFSVHELIKKILLLRYAIDDASADWSVAEAQVRNITLTGDNARGKSTVVSVKATGAAAGQKRKSDEAASTAGSKHKKSRRSLSKKQR